MSGKARCEIKCKHCASWFSSPVQCETTESFHNDFFGLIALCKYCLQYTGCDSGNMRIVYMDDSKASGIEGYSFA